VRLWILSHLVDSPGNRLVEEAARRAGHEPRLVHPGRLSIQIPARPGEPPVLLTERGACGLPDLVFTRMGSSAPADAFDVLRQLEAASLPCVNSSASLEVSRDKVRTFQVLARVGVAIPRTVVIGGEAPLEQVVEPLGPAPWIVKLPVSTQGVGVARADSIESLRSTIDMLRGLGQRVVVQHYVREASGTDVRVLVVGGRAIAAMRRRARSGEVRSNLHRGGTSEEVDLTPAVSSLAEEAARVVGLQVAGVDLLPSGEGPVVCEVNGSPGLEGLEHATRRDLSAEVVSFLESRLHMGRHDSESSLHEGSH
jgi:ribosomal protein S6--L-glutamate ligase